MSDFKNLRVWRTSHELTLSVFPVAGRMRGAGSALIRNQWLRATMSVPTNIAEGSAKQSDPEYVRFLRIALGSVTECEYHVILAHDLHLISRSDYTQLNEKTQIVGKMIAGLIKSLKKDRP
jgi:four helix bundle protein